MLDPYVVWQCCGMDTPPATITYKNHRFPVEILSHAVWLYFRFCLSFRDVEELLAERGVLVTYEPVMRLSLAHATGLGGRDRRAASAAERARQSVTRSIKSAVNKITEYQPILGHLLACAIKTGTYCCYTPNPHETITWDFAAQRENQALSSLQASSLSDGAIPPPASAASDARGGVWRAAINATEFVGRHQETALLRSLIDRVRNGQGSVVLLAGSQGVGKTRLAMEVAENAVRQGFRILIGHCYEREDPYLPFAEMLETELARASSPEVFWQWLAEEAGELAQLMPSLRSAFPDLPPPPQLSPQQARRSLFNSMVTALHRTAGPAPLFLMVEDLQWADEATLALFHHLALRIVDLPVILLGTYHDLNRTPGDWHRRALADTSRVARLFEQSVRICCAKDHDSRDSASGASPHAGRIAPRSLWPCAGAALVAAVYDRPYAQRDCGRAILFPLQCLSGGEGLSGWNAHVCGRDWERR